jgi:hypothetical protein
MCHSTNWLKAKQPVGLHNFQVMHHRCVFHYLKIYVICQSSTTCVRLSNYLYSMGHEKVAGLPFCSCACCCINPLNAELNPICHLLALLGGETIVVVSRLRVNFCIYAMLWTWATFSWPILYF